MITWPNSRAATKLVQQWSPDPAQFIGAGYLPDNNRDFTNSQSISWRTVAGVKGKAPLIVQGQDAPLDNREATTKYTADPAFIKLTAQIDEADFCRLQDLRDPTEMQLAGEELFAISAYRLWLKVQIQKEYLRWKAINNDLTAYTDSDTGVQLAVDYGLGAVTNAGTNWATIASATPLVDIRTKLRAFAGTGAQMVDIVMNQVNANYLFSNEDFRDLVRQSNLAPELATFDVLKRMVQLPGGIRLRNIVVYDDGFKDSSGTYTRFIPDNRVHFIGLSGSMTAGLVDKQETLGDYANVPVMGAGGYNDIRPGDYMLTEDNTRRVNGRHVALACGTGGLPVFYHPEWILRLDPTAGS